MSATGAWVAPTRAFEGTLASLKEWRDGVARELAAFRRWAVVSRLLDDQSATRLAHLERRLAAERLTVAFVAEYARGKSELVNALFFADVATRLLPSGAGRTTLCPVEILWDSTRPPSLRLLPIETRGSEQSLRELIAAEGAWHPIALDPDDVQTVAAALQSLSETVTVSGGQAANLGFTAAAERVEVPRWRYAILNYPHPLLAHGLAILDTPGESALAAEPELTLHRVPDAAAIVFVVAADTGMTAADEALWKAHIAPIEGLEHRCFVALNKIDLLRDAGQSEADVLAEIDRRVRQTADALGVPPQRVFALSARQALAARTSNDRDGLIRSRLYRLEQALAKGLVHQRRLDHAAAVQAEMRPTFAESRALLESRVAFVREQREALEALQGKNQKLVETLARKAGAERLRIEKARCEIVSLRALHNRHVDALAKLLDPNAARESGLRTRTSIVGSKFSGSISPALDAYFAEVRAQLERAIAVIGEVKSTIAAAKSRFSEGFGMLVESPAEFATDRFLLEIDRLREHCERDFKSASSLMLRGRKTLGGLFFDTVALKVVHVFEIADREVRTWMNGFIRPLDAQVNAFQERTNARIEGMGRIQHAETDLVVRMEELEALVREVQQQRAQWESHRERLGLLLAVDREHSLA